MPQDSKPHVLKQTFDVVGTRPLRPDGVDKVTGRARFGADMFAPGMLHGAVLRSPHAHARIKKIDISKAQRLDGVKAIVTADDLPDLTNGNEDLHIVLCNVMARGKVFYDGHAVAAVAAASALIARQALKLIKVDYEVLPHVTDVEEAMKPDAPVLHDNLFTKGVEPKPAKPSNVAHRYQFGHGDVARGFKQADVVIERTFRTAATHQGYIEPHACLANLRNDGSGELWVCTQGHFMVRTICAGLLGLDITKLRVTASEIGGGFGGKTTVFLEPVALALVAQGRPAGEARDEPRGGVPRHRADRRAPPSASRSASRRTAGSLPARPSCKFQGGAFAGLAGRHGRDGGVRLLRPRERPRRRLRRGRQPAEARGLPCAERADGDIRGRERRARSWPTGSAWTRSTCA